MECLHPSKALGRFLHALIFFLIFLAEEGKPRLFLCFVLASFGNKVTWQFQTKLILTLTARTHRAIKMRLLHDGLYIVSYIICG